MDVGCLTNEAAVVSLGRASHSLPVVLFGRQ